MYCRFLSRYEQYTMTGDDNEIDVDTHLSHHRSSRAKLFSAGASSAQVVANECPVWRQRQPIHGMCHTNYCHHCDMCCTDTMRCNFRLAPLMEHKGRKRSKQMLPGNNSFFAKPGTSADENSANQPSTSSHCQSALEIRDDPRFDDLFKSLLSGLPNEVDFSMNVCTLLSHPGPRLIDLSKCARIVSVLVAHAGVFDDTSMSSIVCVMHYYTMHICRC
jgi:hypothetical protein